MALLACVFLVPGAYCIEIGFSAENGGESTDLSSSYDVDTGVSVSEESTASFDQPAIENTRSVSGTGDINAVQTYPGSGGYAGSATLSARDVSGTLQSNAILTPTSSANQITSLSGDSADVSLSLNHQGDSLYMGSGMGSGSINTNQNVRTGSIIFAMNETFANSWTPNGIAYFNTIMYGGIQISKAQDISADEPSPMSSVMSFFPGTALNWKMEEKALMTIV